mgnify:CR=1 FL=1
MNSEKKLAKKIKENLGIIAKNGIKTTDFKSFLYLYT